MNIYLSRYRVTYTPSGAAPIELLSPLDMCDAEPKLEGGPATATAELLSSAWAHHHSRGNASVRLVLDRYTAAPCLAQAQARGLELWRTLTLQPEGDITLETAFAGLITAPLIRWRMRASLASVRHIDLDAASSPFAGSAGYHTQFEFTVSHITDI